ncbi:MAG: TetR family transcriptional regulator [Solirubrobacteraceae bacterium]
MTELTDSPSPDERPLRADARRNRERILASAREVFSESGAEAQIDDVARRAGVGVGTVYRHYPTKEALLTELVREKFRMLTAGGRTALGRTGEPFEVLTDWLRDNAAQLGRDAAMQQAVAGAGDQVWIQVAAEQQALATVTDELLGRARAAGTVRPDATADDIGMLMSGVCATMAHPAPGFDWHRHLELIIDALRLR